MSGDGYRSRALVYSLECFFDALAFKDLFPDSVSFRFSMSVFRDLSYPTRNRDRLRSATKRRIGNLRNFLLRPFEIVAHLARILKPLRKPRARLCKASLRLCLQLEQLAVLGIQVARSVELAVSRKSKSTRSSLAFWRCC